MANRSFDLMMNYLDLYVPAICAGTTLQLYIPALLTVWKMLNFQKGVFFLKKIMPFIHFLERL